MSSLQMFPGGNSTVDGNYVFGHGSTAYLFNYFPADDGSVNAYSVNSLYFRVLAGDYDWDLSYFFNAAFVQHIGTLQGIMQGDGNSDGSYIDYEFDLSDASSSRVYYPGDRIEVDFTSDLYAVNSRQYKPAIISGHVDFTPTEATGDFLMHDGKILKTVNYLNPVPWSASLEGTYYLYYDDEYHEITLDGNGNMHAPHDMQYYTRQLKSLRR